MAKEYTKEELENAVRNSKSYSDIYRNLNLKINGGSYKWMRKLIEKHQIDTSHFMSKAERMAKMTELSNVTKSIILYDKDDISNGERMRSKTLQSFMKFKGTPMKCNVCSLEKWLDKPIRLDIDHVDGNCVNNHINNLQYICPNCHRQKTIEVVETEKGVKSKYKMLRKIDSNHHKCLDCDNMVSRKSSRCNECFNLKRLKILWPCKETLEKMVWSIPTSQLAKQLGVSDVSIAKRCKKLGIAKPEKGYWRKIECLKNTDQILE